MSDIFFLVLRRMRVPLIFLVSVYAVATLGMTLIPGVDSSGEPWRMSFFHAFYFVSFMGTTIGFGEIPYAFTDAQRAWVLICIYTSVIAWLYGIGSLLRLVQDETFRNAVAQRAFRMSIKRIDQPFYIICGFGETGQLINQGLLELGILTVIIDRDSERTNALELQSELITPIVLNADITRAENLISAGINLSACKGVIAVTQNDHTNLKIAVACKLVNSAVPVICRSEVQDEADNMASFGTDAIINPYLTFGRRINLLTQNPGLHRIQNWFINQHSTEHIHQRVSQQGLPKGKWIICGYGRLGKAIERNIQDEEIEIVVVEEDPIAKRAPQGSIVGRGTEAKTLQEAGIEQASVIVAASDDDANNLSILITAQQLNKDIYTIGRVSREADHMLFVRARCDYIMRRSQVVANEVLTIISRPLVTKFIQYSSSLTPHVTQDLIKRICALTDTAAPITWRLIVDHENAPALVRFLQAEGSLSVGDPLQENDELLLCGHRNAKLLAQRLRNNPELVDSLINGNQHQIPLLRWLSRRRPV